MVVPVIKYKYLSSKRLASNNFLGDLKHIGINGEWRKTINFINFSRNFSHIRIHHCWDQKEPVELGVRDQWVSELGGASRSSSPGPIGPRVGDQMVPESNGTCAFQSQDQLGPVGPKVKDQMVPESVD